MGKGATGSLTVKVVDKGLDKLKKLDRQLRDGQTFVKVGLIGNQKGAGQPRDGGIDTVGLGIVHEYGSPKMHIPERSWIRSTFDMNRGRYEQLTKFYVRKIYEGAITPERALGLLGVQIANDIKNRVTQGQPIPPPNAEATLAKKMKLSRAALNARTRKAAKADGVKTKGAAQGPLLIRTLIDTSRMVNSVSWVVSVAGSEEKAG